MRIRFLLFSMTVCVALLFSGIAAFGGQNTVTPANGVQAAVLADAANGDSTILVAANQYDIIGRWVQHYNGEEIAHKEIYMQGGTLKIKYLWLDSQFTGGKYSSITVESNGTYTFTERYRSYTGQHRIKLINEDTIQGSQTGRQGLVTNYVMTRM